MKPSFALIFTDDAISLLHRTARGWMEVGNVALGDPNMETGLAYLRASALGLEPGGMTTKLVIPNSQIRYMTLPAAEQDAASRRALIRRELEGRTPYEVDDLVFDWWSKGRSLQVAVVARETLAEAEAFATANRLNPLSFVAIPGPGQFGAEPWFGPTTLSDSLLAPGEKVDRDQDPVQIAGHLPRTQMPVETMPADTASDRQADASVAPADEPLPPPADEIASDEPAKAMPLPDAAAEGLASAQPPETATPEEAGSAEGDVPLTDVGASEAAVVQSRGAGTASALTIAADVTANMIPDQAETSAPDEGGPQITPAKPAAETGSIRMATDPRRGRKAVPLPRPGGRSPAQEAPEAARPGTATPARKASLPGRGTGSAISAAAGAGRPQAGAAASDPPDDARQGPARTGAMVKAAGIAPSRERKVTVVSNRGSGSRTGGAHARTAATPAVAQFANRSPTRARPRFLALIVTGILLLLLVAVAAWSSYLIAFDLGEDEPAVAVAAVGTPALPAAAAAEPGLTDLSAATGDTLAGPGDLAEFADVSPAKSEAGPVAAPASDVTVAAADTAAAPPVEAATVVQPAMTAADIRNPGVEPREDEMLLAGVVPGISRSDALALAAPETPPDPAPLSQPAPPPFGTRYQPDIDRRTMPQAAGILMPGGVLVVAGPPPRIPPQRPEATAQSVIEAGSSAQSPAPPGAAGAVPVVLAAPAVEDARPRLRPSDRMPTEIGLPDTAAELTQAPAGRESSLRPRARPPELLAAAASAPQAETAVAQAAGASLVATAGQGAGSPLAVAVSRKPAERPAQANAAVEEAVAVAASDASLVPDTATLASAAPAPQPLLAVKPTADDPEAAEIDEPEIASAAPSVPTRASVAKQATYRNSINLSKINLIGVYGSSSNRYAMVRQANGRFIKVAVGDRVDGGRVAAISDRELHYVKNGTTHKLALPKS